MTHTKHRIFRRGDSAKCSTAFEMAALQLRAIASDERGGARLQGQRTSACLTLSWAFSPCASAIRADFKKQCGSSAFGRTDLRDENTQLRISFLFLSTHDASLSRRANSHYPSALHHACCCLDPSDVCALSASTGPSPYHMQASSRRAFSWLPQWPASARACCFASDGYLLYITINQYTVMHPFPTFYPSHAIITTVNVLI